MLRFAILFLLMLYCLTASRWTWSKLCYPHETKVYELESCFELQRKFIVYFNPNVTSHSDIYKHEGIPKIGSTIEFPNSIYVAEEIRLNYHDPCRADVTVNYRVSSPNLSAS